MKKISFANTARFVAAIPVAIGIACHALALPFVSAGALNAGRSDHTATLLADGRVLVAGGADTSNNFIPFCELYNPTAGTWTVTAPMVFPRVGHTATLLPNGKVLVTGGYSAATGRLASAESYDPATGLWTITMPMTTARTAHTATLLANGMVLVTGGFGGASGTWLASAEMFNPITGSWWTVAPLQTARSQHTATLLADGKVFVTGGYNVHSLAGAEVFDSATGTWTSRPSMIVPRTFHSATLLANGKVLVAGGLNDGGNLSSAELFDPTFNGWLMTPPMAVAKQEARATLLSNGKVLVTGGYNTSGHLPAAEIYDPPSGTWLFSLPMLNPRVGHTATLLANGKVLVAGGYNTAAGCLSAAELYGCLVSLNAAGGTATPATKIYYDDGAPYGSLPVPSRTSYLFAGWWTGQDGAGIRATDTAFLASVFDHTLYAKWTGPVTVSTPVPVPYTWLAQYPVAGQSDADYETAARADSDGDGHAAWQEYLAGSVPTNAHSFFQAGIAVSNGTPRLTWSPDLGSARVYLFEGKANLTDSAWGTTNAGSRFFRAKVSMP